MIATTVPRVEDYETMYGLGYVGGPLFLLLDEAARAVNSATNIEFLPYLRYDSNYGG